jgi:hypothetical protein
MGYTGAALQGTPESVYFNPAGLGEIGNSVVSFTYEALRQSALTPDQLFSSETLRNRSLQFIALAAKGAAFSWRPLADETLHEIGAAGYNDNEIKINAYTVSASNKQSSYSTGLNISYLSGRIARSGIESGVPFAGISDGNGVSIDLGFLYTPVKQITFGLDLQNVFGMMWWDDYEKEQLPFCLRTGVAFKASGYLTFATDLEKRFYRREGDATDIVHFGMEQKLGSIIQIRAGAYGSDLNNGETTHITAGLGYTDAAYELALSGERYKLDMKDVYRFVFSLNLPIGQ